ncbi:hypothetical protein [Prescottella equi]
MVGAYWRGEITLRQLRVYIQQLPPTSALHRARMDGHAWGNVEALLWLISHKLGVLDQRLVWHRGKRPRWPDFKEFPWKKDQRKLGDRAGAAVSQVVDYLRAIGPGGKGLPHGDVTTTTDR